MKKFLRGLLLTLLVLGCLLTAAYFYVGARAEKILADLIERETGGRIKTDIDRVRFNWKKMNLSLSGSRFYSADTLNEPTTYDIRVQRLVLELSALKPLLFDRRLLLDTIICMRPDIVVTRRKEIAREKMVLASEMNKVYEGLSKIVAKLNVGYCVVDSGRFTLVNRLLPEQRPVSVTDFYLQIDNLGQQNDSLAAKRSLFTDRIKFYSSNQDILLPDGRHRLRFKRFRINSAKRYIEIDSCYFSRKTDATGSNGLEVFADTLRLSGVDFFGLTTTGIIRADSARCINAKINFITRIGPSEATALRTRVPLDRDSAAQLLKNLLGDLQVGYLGLLNAGLEWKRESDGRVTTYASRRSDFILNDLSIINHPDSNLRIGSFRFGMQGYRSYDSDSLYAVRFEQIRFDNTDVLVSDFSLMPTGRNLNFADRKAISMKALRLEGISWIDLLLNRKLVADRVTLERPGFDISASGTKGKGGNTSGQYFTFLRRLSQQLDARQLLVRNASVDYRSSAALRLRFRQVNLDIRLRELLASKNRNQLLGSFSPVTFGEAEIDTKGTRITVRQGRFITVSRSLYARSMKCSFGDGKAGGEFGNVQLKDLQEEKAGGFRAGSLAWSEAAIVVNSVERGGSPSPAARMPLLRLQALEGANTSLRFRNAELGASMQLDRLKAGPILINHGERPLLENLFLQGNSFLLENGVSLMVRADGFEIQDGAASRLSGISLRSMGTKTGFSIRAPELDFIPDIGSVMNGKHVFRKPVLLNPVINFLDPSAATVIRTRKSGKSPLPHLYFDSLQIIKPVLQTLSSGLSHMLDRPPSMSDWIVHEIRSNGNSLSIGRIALAASDMGLRSTAFDMSLTARDTLTLLGNNLVFSPVPAAGAASWSGMLSEVDLTGARITMKGADSAVRDVHLKGLRLSKLALASGAGTTLPQLFKQSPELELKVDALSSVKSLAMLSARGLRYDNGCGALTADSLALVPTIDRDSFNSSQKYQKDYITLRTGAVSISGISPDHWHRDSVFQLGKVSLERPVLQVYKDKRLPFQSGVHKPLPTDMLQRHAQALRIDTLDVSKGDITYEELNEKTLKNGIVRFTRLNAQLLHIAGSGHVPGDSLRLIASASLLDSIHFRLRFMQAYLDTQHTFNFAFRMSPFDMRRLNPMLAPLMSAKIKRGMLDTMRLNAFGREYLTHGKMKMYYRGLRAAYLNNGDENSRTLKTRLITFLANSIILRSSNRKGLGQVYVERKRDRSVFNYWLKIILSGVISSTGVSSNKKVENKYYRSLRQLNLPEIPDIGL